jgi:hypothetical protein
MALVSPACATKDGRPAAAADFVEVKTGSEVVGVSRLHPGVTHTQFSADPDNEPEAVASGRGLLAAQSQFQNQHIMGWGALNPEPSPGVYRWDSLDSRIELIRQTSGIPVITLCCAPDWMKGGRWGKTDWSKINAAPTARHYADFAALAGKVARRYPDVRYYQVWHGLKGFYNPKLHRWNYEGYTRLYNLVYRELKSVNAEIAVGGPVVTMDSWSDESPMTKPSDLKGPWGIVDQRALDAVAYWLEHKEGADFISLDLSTANKDGVSPSDAFDSLLKINAVSRWVRQRSELPLWAARWHPFPGNVQESGATEQSALLASALVQMINSNVQVELLWQPQGKGASCIGCLWTDTRAAGGGQPTEAYTSIDAVAARFPPGTPLVRTTSSSPDITALSSPEVTLLINELPQQQEVSVDGSRTSLGPHEVRIVARGATGGS